MAGKIQQVLRAIGRSCEGSRLTEAEVEKVFQQEGFFSTLGYAGIGRDILAQRGRFRKRYDLGLLGFGGRVRVIIEFKKEDVGPLEDFQQELFDKYVKPHVSSFGVLTNGIDLIVYARTNGQLVKQDSFRLSEVSRSQALNLENWLQKQPVDLELLPSVLGLLKNNRKHPLLIDDPGGEATRVFFQVFQLRPESAFGRLVSSLKDSLLRTAERSSFTRGSYEFWKRTYARELNFKDVPKSWRPFLATKAAHEITQFSFALETGYTIISRLMLAKAADDKGFPGVRFGPRIEESLRELSTRNRLKPEHYLEVVRRSFERAGETLFDSIFLQDIFDWWLECAPSESRGTFMALAEATLAVTQFNFYNLSGDLLGDLYQHYFDPETRKALGEFYTPGEVVEFMLDECGYRGQRDRFLDPACGSGSFLAAALRRYIQKQGGKNKKEVLRDLTEGLRIVGFDINPFAVLLAQVNYAALILPLYAEAKHEDPDFQIARLPVFRTDSLRIEEGEIEAGAQGEGGLQIRMHYEEEYLDLRIYLPIRSEKKGKKGRELFVSLYVKVPRFSSARKKGVVGNLEEYVAALARVFQAARDNRFTLEGLLRARFGARAAPMKKYFQPTLDELESTLVKLKGEYDDGRFLKAIEDLVLAVSVKHDLRFDYVVGNPPYVRIQKIPGYVKEFWADKYEWPEGNYDLFVPFMERAVHAGRRAGWLSESGKLCFILSDRFLNVDYGTRLREKLPDDLEVDLLFDFRDTRLFAEALNYPAILLAHRGNNGRKGNLLAARVFSSESQFSDLLAEFKTLRKKRPSNFAARGDALEVFAYPRMHLAGSGWWLMPPEEKRVLEKLRAASGARLINLTATVSGGFAGYQTSGDKYLVFDEVEDCGRTLKVLPRHRGGQDGANCSCSNKPIELEKGALRPFLFGKDVSRWTINWKRSWVLFPYDQYLKKALLDKGEEDTAREWNLIPCKKNLGMFQFADSKKVELFEERFPKAWKHLKIHEEVLRKREGGRYQTGRPEAHMWYGATYPRGLDYYFRPKLVLQVLSRRPSVSVDVDGQFVFTAGGTAGVYGIALRKSKPKYLESMIAVLNSNAVDFCVKQISSVFGDRFYSYGDQFIADINIPTNVHGFQSLAGVSEQLINLHNVRKSLVMKVRGFPQSFDSEVHRYELDEIGRLTESPPPSAQLIIDLENVAVEKGLYGYHVLFGSQQRFEFEEEVHALCLAQALRCRNRKTLPAQDVLSWRLPIKVAGAKTLLGLLNTARKDLEKVEKGIEAEENRLNELVYDLYGLGKKDRKIIEDFLARYSSYQIRTEVDESENAKHSGE